VVDLWGSLRNRAIGSDDFQSSATSDVGVNGPALTHGPGSFQESRAVVIIRPRLARRRRGEPFGFADPQVGIGYAYFTNRMGAKMGGLKGPNTAGCKATVTRPGKRISLRAGPEREKASDNTLNSQLAIDEDRSRDGLSHKGQGEAG
jgi:hypothetical protein